MTKILGLSCFEKNISRKKIVLCSTTKKYAPFFQDLHCCVTVWHYFFSFCRGQQILISLPIKKVKLRQQQQQGRERTKERKKRIRRRQTKRYHHYCEPPPQQCLAVINVVQFFQGKCPLNKLRRRGPLKLVYQIPPSKEKEKTQ